MSRPRAVAALLAARPGAVGPELLAKPSLGPITPYRLGGGCPPTPERNETRCESVIALSPFALAHSTTQETPRKDESTSPRSRQYFSSSLPTSRTEDTVSVRDSAWSALSRHLQYVGRLDAPDLQSPAEGRTWLRKSDESLIKSVRLPREAQTVNTAPVCPCSGGVRCACRLGAAIGACRRQRRPRRVSLAVNGAVGAHHGHQAACHPPVISHGPEPPDAMWRGRFCRGAARGTR